MVNQLYIVMHVLHVTKKKTDERLTLCCHLNADREILHIRAQKKFRPVFREKYTTETIRFENENDYENDN